MTIQASSAAITTSRGTLSAVWRSRPSTSVTTLAFLLCILIVPPAWFLFNVSVHHSNPDGTLGDFTFAHYAGLFSGRFFWPSLINTIIYSLGTAIVALVFGITQALIVERTNAPGRKWVFLGAIIALGIPNVLHVVSWLLILGRAGPVNNAIAATLGPHFTMDVYSLWGMILIEGMNFVPLVFLLMSAVLRSQDASFEEASMMSGGRPLRTFWSISMRMGLPGILALLLLVFIRAFESFEVPALVGLAGNINVLTTNIYQSSRGQGFPKYGEAGAYSVCLLIIVIFLIYLYNRLSRNAHKYQSITGKGYRPRVIDLGPAKWFGTALLVFTFLLVTGLPILILIFASLQPFFDGMRPESFGRFTLDNYRLLAEARSFHDAIGNTLVMGAATATVVVPLTAVCAWLAARRAPGAWVLDQLATSPLVFPAIVMSVAFLYVFVSLPIALYGTLLSLIIASTSRYLPYGMRYAYAGVLQIHKELEDASASSGARQLTTFLRIVVPLLAPALIGGWLFVFLLSVQAISLPLLLVGPGSEIVSVTLFDLWQNGQVTELAAMGVIWIGLMTVVSSVFYYVTRRFQIS
jgi:iron(III) transport system permease protein